MNCEHLSNLHSKGPIIGKIMATHDEVIIFYVSKREKEWLMLLLFYLKSIQDEAKLCNKPFAQDREKNSK